MPVPPSVPPAIHGDQRRRGDRAVHRQRAAVHRGRAGVGVGAGQDGRAGLDPHRARARNDRVEGVVRGGVVEDDQAGAGPERDRGCVQGAGRHSRLAGGRTDVEGAGGPIDGDDTVGAETVPPFWIVSVPVPELPT